jgi:4-hydroxybenzoate polyprenyltransferase
MWREEDGLHREMAPPEEITMIPYSQAVSRTKAFLALSRTAHGLMDMATPALAALLCLGAVPSPRVTMLGFITAFAGYTAVYALNDIVDYRRDRQRMGMAAANNSDYLDSVFIRHPIAQGVISYGSAFSWTLAWALIAFVGAYLLNPISALIFLLGILLETVYCLMLQVSHLRVLVSGVVKTLGAMAAVLAVQPGPPSPLFVSALFAWLFAWEVGGQNVPADWHDVDEDRSLGFRTVPVMLGLAKGRILVLSSIILALLLGIVVFLVAPGRISAAACTAALLVGVYLLFTPAYRLYRSGSGEHVTDLFNKASHYPLALFVIVAIDILVKRILA